jgi:hypothetical protein
MLQKALKMDQGQSYYDVISDLKFMDAATNMNMLEMPMPYSTGQGEESLNWDDSSASAWKSGILAMSSNLLQAQGSYKPGVPLVQTTITNIPVEASPKQSSGSKPSTSASTEPAAEDHDGLRLLISPWSKIMFPPPPHAIIIDRMHSGARRFVVLDFGTPILLTDLIVPSAPELISLSIDTWLTREEVDCRRLVVAQDIGMRTLVINDLQPPAICRYLKVKERLFIN